MLCTFKGTIPIYTCPIHAGTNRSLTNGPKADGMSKQSVSAMSSSNKKVNIPRIPQNVKHTPGKFISDFAGSKELVTDFSDPFVLLNHMNCCLITHLVLITYLEVH